MTRNPNNTTTLELIVVGVGNVGGYWLDQFASKLPPTVKVRALFSSKHQLNIDGETIKHWRQRLADTPRVDVAPAILDCVQNASAEVAILDLTASLDVSQRYSDWLSAGAHVICANKYAGASELENYQSLVAQAQLIGKHWLYNTTVGAGLPIQKAIQERLHCGDGIHSVSGVFSGSLSWLCYQRSHTQQSFSQLLNQAAEEGLTEPDPREDLGGLDVARKLLILAREARIPLQLEDIDVENLVPDTLQKLSLKEFWRQSNRLDEHLNTDYGDGHFHYIGTVERQPDGQVYAYAKLQRLAPDSVYLGLSAGDNLFQIYSDHYKNTPLVIQGPGAGRRVTAAGVHSDVLDLVARLKKA